MIILALMACAMDITGRVREYDTSATDTAVDPCVNDDDPCCGQNLELACMLDGTLSGPFSFYDANGRATVWYAEWTWSDGWTAVYHRWNIKQHPDAELMAVQSGTFWVNGQTFFIATSDRPDEDLLVVPQIIDGYVSFAWEAGGYAGAISIKQED